MDKDDATTNAEDCGDNNQIPEKKNADQEHVATLLGFYLTHARDHPSLRPGGHRDLSAGTKPAPIISILIPKIPKSFYLYFFFLKKKTAHKPHPHPNKTSV